MALLGCSDAVVTQPFRDAGPMDAALRFDVVGFDVIRTDRQGVMRPEVLDLTDAEFLPGQLDVNRMDRPCASELPGDYRFFAEGPSGPLSDRVTLSLPRRFRFERRLPGMTTPAVCETSVPACGAVDAVDVDELAVALTDPEVLAAFAAGQSLFGCDARTSGGSVLVLERGTARITLGDPCRVCAPMACAAPPGGVQRLTDILAALRDQELLRPVCRDLATRDAGPSTSVDAVMRDGSVTDASVTDAFVTDASTADVAATDAPDADGSAR